MRSAQPAPTIVIFGATGSLATSKLIPALYNLHRKGRLPSGTRIIGVARQELGDDRFRDMLEAALRSIGAAVEPAAWREFARRVHFVGGDVSSGEGLAAVKQALESGEPDGGRLYYLALAPWLYPKTIDGLLQAGLAGRAQAGDAGFRRVIIEKPFGHDLESARALHRKILTAFDESQVFRIDHFLGKETVQNILVFRFANIMFEPLWSRNFIDHVQITAAESKRVEDRGPYYDGAGVLRDMFQNHLMQLLCLVAIEAPSRFEADALRGEKVKLLSAVRRIDEIEARLALVAGQYQGYTLEPGVRKESGTPTFAAARLFIDNWRWQGVPFYLRSGKGLARRVSEIVVQFLAPPHNMFELPAGQRLDPNRLSLGIQPDEGVHIRFETKVPDRGMEVRSSTLVFHFADQEAAALPDAYERLLLDALSGDGSLFMREDEIEQAWSIIDPLTRAQEDPAAPPPEIYPVGSWGPSAADRLLTRDGRAWTLETVSQAGTSASDEQPDRQVRRR
jgi:glucose-6-phosphate 1-dehydrogenase